MFSIYICLTYSLFSILFLFSSPSLAVTFDVKASNEQCFFERTTPGQKIHASFEVVSGGNREIDFKVIDSKSDLVYEVKKKKDGTLQFYSLNTGTYTFCFSNQAARLTDKIVAFNLFVDEARFKEERQGTVQPLEASLSSLQEGLQSVEHAQSNVKAQHRLNAMYISRPSLSLS